LYNGSPTSATSVTVNIPANGVTVFASLVYCLNGTQTWIQYTYRESGSPTLPFMISPAAGSTLASSQTFTWNPGAGPTLFELKLGTGGPVGGPLSKDLYNGSPISGTSVTVNIPANGVTVFASLVYRLNGTQNWISYTYKEP
jgi:hypothetical protein